MATLSLSRVNRLLSVLEFTAPPHSQTAREIAEHLGLGIRTVERDIELLRTVGFDLTGALAAAAADEVEIGLTAEQVGVLLLAATGSLDAGPHMGDPTLRDVIEKLCDSLPPAQKEVVNDMVDTTSSRLDSPVDVDRTRAYRKMFSAALQDRREIRMTYDSVFDGKHIALTLRVYHLTYRYHAWYAIGHASEHDAVRTFHMGRVVTARILDSTYVIPEDFCVDDYFGNAWRMIRGETEYDVVIRFSPVVARSVAAVEWHSTQRTVWEDDGSLIYRVRVAGLSEICSWVLGYGAAAEVLEPPRLRAEMQSRLFAMSRFYR